MRKSIGLLVLAIWPLLGLAVMPAAAAEAHYVITNGGVDVTDSGHVLFVPAGHRDEPNIASGHSGDTVDLPDGKYDVHLLFSDGFAQKDVWLANQTVTGKFTKTVEMALPIAEVRVVITNGGADVTDSGHVLFYPAGHRDAATIASGHSGDSVRLPAGVYDVHLLFSDGSAQGDVWLANQNFAGKVTKTVEMGVAIAELRVVITNGGVDVTDSGHVAVYPAGHRDAAVIASGHSGDTTRLPQGVYDVHVSFSDGAANKDLWLANQTLTGKVDKTVEMGVAVAEMRVLITNGGIDVADSGHMQFFPAGHRNGGNVASGHSGDSVRIPAGAYDLEVWFSEGMITKRIWLANLNVAGKSVRSVELGLHTAEPTVTVTQNGSDVGDKASVAYIDPATHAELGSVRSGEATLLEAGTYDIHASLFGAEGWLRRVALSGKPRLTIEIKPLQTAELHVGGPPPAACAIEVYGVNFDFNKSSLRPDSEPMLKRILALFTGNPSFSAEIGGHTDNIGTPEYNLKLSDARAASVKAWLQAHGVAAARVASHGYGDTRPLVPNTTDENRFKNRRVELRTANCR
jgi:hypothetical protein